MILSIRGIADRALGRPFALREMQGQPPALGSFVVSIDRIFKDIMLLAIHDDGRTFESEFLGITIQLLEECSAHPEGEIVD